jgi:hypothetical protein
MKRPTLKASILSVMILGGAGLGLACHLALPILGGPTQETTETPCDDGTWCPNAYPLCPVAAGGHCEANDQPGEVVELARVSDAGDAGLHHVRRQGPLPHRHGDGGAAHPRD